MLWILKNHLLLYNWQTGRFNWIVVASIRGNIQSQVSILLRYDTALHDNQVSAFQGHILPSPNYPVIEHHFPEEWSSATPLQKLKTCKSNILFIYLNSVGSFWLIQFPTSIHLCCNCDFFRFHLSQSQHIYTHTHTHTHTYICTCWLIQ